MMGLVMGVSCARYGGGIRAGLVGVCCIGCWYCCVGRIVVLAGVLGGRGLVCGEGLEDLAATYSPVP
jgi:hypothetical protein